MTQFSLHLQFCDSSIQFSDKENRNKNETMSCGKKDKVCEKCNYVHLVHCPLGEMIQEHRSIRRSQKLDQMRNNMLNKRKLLSSQYKRASRRIPSKQKCFSTDDEIKMEGIKFILPQFSQTYICICIYIYIYIYIYTSLQCLYDKRIRNNTHKSVLSISQLRKL